MNVSYSKSTSLRALKLVNTEYNFTASTYVTILKSPS